MGCAQGKCCLPRQPRGGAGGGGGPGGRGGATLGRAVVPSAGMVLEYATLTVAGLYPDSPGRESQDAYLVSTRFAGDPDLHVFAVFDGHGACGAACAAFARDSLPRLLAADGGLLVADPAAAFREAMAAANAEMHAAVGVDDLMSGTTAVAALVGNDERRRAASDSERRRAAGSDERRQRGRGAASDSERRRRRVRSSLRAVATAR